MLLMLKKSKNQCKKTSQFKTQCNGDVKPGHTRDACSLHTIVKHGGRCHGGHGPSKTLVGGSTMHLAPPIIGLYIC